MIPHFFFAFLAAFLVASAPIRAASDETELLSTLGYTTGQSLLLTHMAIGTLADAFKAKTYRSGEATSFVETYISVTQGMKEQMQKLIAANTLSKEDAQFIEKTVKVLDLVLNEGDALKDFLSSGDDDDDQVYDKARKKAKREIKSLLGMKD